MPSDVPAPFPERFNIAAHFLDRPAREHGSRVAIAGEPAVVRYDELSQLANRAGNALRGEGCRPGDRVLIALPDSAEFIASFLGLAKIGAVAVPVNPAVHAAEFAYFLADSGARMAIVHETVLPEFLATGEGGLLERIAVVGAMPDAREGVYTRGKFLSWPEWVGAASPALKPHPTASTDTAFFLYTSGSGGQPKAAVHQHKDMLITSRGFAAGVLGLRPDDLVLSVSKLFFAYGLGNGMYFPFSVGARTLLNPDRPRAEKVIEMVARHRPTVFFAVPTFYAALLRDADRGVSMDFSSVRLAVSAGEMLPAEIFEQFQSRFGLAILDGIGSTEMLHMFISSRPGLARAGSCGVEVPGYEARIVDDAGAPVPTGEIGNLWVNGQSAFVGYWNKPELTARTKREEWIATGDKFYRDPEGYYHYCGRSDDMMKVAGMWVSPGEVENALLGHPLVAEAAVVAASGGGLTRPVAFVVLRAGAVPSRRVADEIRDFVRQQLAGYKCPQEVHVLEQLPKTATGKIQRYRLREVLEGGSA
ncbi:MAG: benzoate-CoA ligase family protein [Acidobacteria bacterium]|nr:benzoate-CoA ligase family protein [Acidobacteriota bacterium]